MQPNSKSLAKGATTRATQSPHLGDRPNTGALYGMPASWGCPVARWLSGQLQASCGAWLGVVPSMLRTMIDLRVVKESSLPVPLVASLTDMLGELVLRGAALGWTKPPTLSEVTELIGTLAAGPAGESCLVVAETGHQVAAFGYWRRYQRPTHRPHADLEKGAVAPSFAGEGLGRRLLRELIEQARLAGVEQLTLDFRGDNQTAEHLYLSEGFKEYGRLPDFVAPGDGRRLDKVFHVLDLRDADR